MTEKIENATGRVLEKSDTEEHLYRLELHRDVSIFLKENNQRPLLQNCGNDMTKDEVLDLIKEIEQVISGILDKTFQLTISWPWR